MKRFFKMKNRKSRLSALGERPSRAERQSSRDDSIGVTTLENELAGFKLAPKKDTEPNQATKKGSYAASTGSDRKSKGSSTDPKNSKEDEEPAAVPTKSKGVEKKANGNSTLPACSSERGIKRKVYTGPKIKGGVSGKEPTFPSHVRPCWIFPLIL